MEVAGPDRDRGALMRTGSGEVVEKAAATGALRLGRRTAIV